MIILLPNVLTMNKSVKSSLAPALTLIFIFADTVHADDTIVLDKVLVEGITSPGDGLLTPQHGTQAKSIVTRTAIERKNSQNNVYQAMDLVPGVNTYSSTGLFGGGIRMRGFNSDQIGITIDGVPMDDAGNL